MALPDIDFKSIRPVNGSRNSGFEELCCQLAALETAPLGGHFHTKGRGADSGVECYRQLPDGKQIGWQAKYLFEWNSSLASQLNKSIGTALEKHPNLVEYIVCLPFNFPDGKSEKKQTAEEKCLAWQSKWTAVAKQRERPLTITLWRRSELTAILTKDDPLYSGRVLYWFSRESFSSQWYRTQFRYAKTSLGNRYTPETNVDLPIRRDLLAFARHPEINNVIEDWFYRVTEQGSRTKAAIHELASESDDPSHGVLYQELDRLQSLLGVAPIGPERLFPTRSWMDAASRCSDAAGDALAWVDHRPRSNSSDDAACVSRARRCLHGLLQVLYEIEDALRSNRWKLANKKAALLQGPAGIGKSHLLADIVEHHLRQGGPALLLLGEKFIDNEVWPQIRDQLDRPPLEQFKRFLGSLDAAAQRAGLRALVCIDALNERHGIDVWSTRLAAFLETARTFPRIGVVLSCRTTFVPWVIPNALRDEHLFRIDHQGFAATAGEAAKAYLDQRGIVRPSAPQLVPEFDNPLFLKTCCDALDQINETEIPKGLRGVNSIFSFYTDAVITSLNTRMRLDPRQRIVPRAIDRFTNLLVKAGEGRVPHSDALDAVESLYSSEGHFERCLLSQLENEGLLTVEPLRQEDDSVVLMVRFTFERFSDHMIANCLLDNHLDGKDVHGSFQSGRALHELVFGSRGYYRAGVINAIAIQLPERTGVEILDVNENPPHLVREAFRLGLLWREQSNFTARTFELAHASLRGHQFNDVLISVSTEPSNSFNALFLHKRLLEMTMPSRDVSWSVYLAQRGYNGPIETIISWALNNGFENIEDDRAYLAATTLTWFFTTSHREVRDKATKALASVLATRLHIGARLLREFAEVNDPYVLERLLAACYGAALQDVADAGLAELALAVKDTVFSDGQPPLDALLRDHAQRLLEHAAMRGELPSSINIDAARPPHQSHWPIEQIPDDLIATYTEEHRGQHLRDDIVMSTVNDGDFARYIIDTLVSLWSPAPLGTDPLPTSPDPDDPAQADAVAFFRNSNRKLPLRQFSVHLARRWICKRAHDLGWTQARFGQFEDRVGTYGRTPKRMERIGKKYQWIALRELIARMADNLAFIGGIGGWDDDDTPEYQGSQNVRLRDIDPSLLIARTFFDAWGKWGKTWWVPFNPQLPTIGPHERVAWLDSDSDLINDSTLIGLHDPDSGRDWLALDGYASWSGHGVQNGSKTTQRDTWYRLKCMVVAQNDLDATVASLQQRILTGPFNFPSINLYSNVFLGEYPGQADLDSFVDSDFWARDWNPPGHIYPTVSTYTCEQGGFDFAIDKTVSFNIPAPWLIRKMSLRLKNGRSPVYLDSNGKTIFYDPCLVEDGPSTALLERTSFLRMLERHDLAAIWVIAGEKSIYGSSEPAAGFGGSLRHTAVYTLKGAEFSRQYCTDRQLPSDEQVKRFFEGRPVPFAIATRPKSNQS